MSQVLKCVLVGVLAFALSWFSATRQDVAQHGAETFFWFSLATVAFIVGLAAVVATMDLIAPRKRN